MRDYSEKITKQLHATPDDDEIWVAKVLVDTYDWRIMFLARKLSSGAKTPDIQTKDGLKWEIKTPKSNTKYTLSRTIKSALKQSSNIIISLSKFKGYTPNGIKKLEREFRLSPSAKRMKIITKDREILDFEK